MPTPIPVLVLLAMGSPIALNALLPALPLIANDFSVSTGLAQLSLSMYLAALAIGQLCLGGLVNAQGLKPSLTIGLASFVTGSVFGMLQGSIELLLIGRILQGLGGAVMISISRALLVENYGAKVAPQKMGYIIMAIALSQSIAPLLGSYITSWFGWGYIFLMTCVHGAVLLLLSHYFVQTSTIQKKRSSMGDTIKLYQALLKDSSFRTYAIANTLLACSFYFFVSTSPYLVSAFDQSSSSFGYWFMSITLAFMLGGYLSTYINRYLSVDQAIFLGNGIATLGAVALMGAAIMYEMSYETLFIPMCFVTLGRGISQPCYQSAAISGTVASSGMAAGLMGFLQLSFGALSSQISPFIAAQWELSLSLSIVLCTILASLIHQYGCLKRHG